MAINILPNELINQILSYNPHDKIYYSYVSKLWAKICMDSYNATKNKDSHKYPQKCAYDLNLWLREFGQINHKGCIYSIFSDVNTLNVLSQYALDNGILYGRHMEISPLVNLHNDDKFEKTIGIDDWFTLLTKRNQYPKIINYSFVTIFSEYCIIDKLNEYTKFVIKVLYLYNGYTYLKMANMALSNNAKNISGYLTKKYNEE